MDLYIVLWPAEAFSRYGISYELSAMPKSGLYGALLPLLNSGRIDLLDNSKLISQLANLERRTVRGGRDSIDHPQGQHDDLGNAVAALASLCIAESGCSIELLQRCNGTFDEELAAEQALQRLAAGAPRPLSGPDQLGAVRLGDGGYWVPSISEQWRLAVEEAQSARGRAAGEAEKNGTLP